MENDQQNSGRETAKCPLLPPMLPADEGKRTLVLDMDGSLLREYGPQLYNTFTEVPVSRDFFLRRKSSGDRTYVSKRPRLETCLLRLHDFYEIVVFTESSKHRADLILDSLINGHVIRHRLYRDSCTDVDGRLAKDLSRLGRDLSNVILLDDCPFSYVLQPANALPIPTFHAGLHDVELWNRQCFLTKELPRTDADVRAVIANTRFFGFSGAENCPPPTDRDGALVITPRNVLTARSLGAPLLPPLDEGRPTLVLDMDETLLHERVPPRQLPGRAADFVYERGGRTSYVYLRPGVEEFLTRMADLFEIVLFTASVDWRADKLAEMFDGRGRIRFRLYRDSCSMVYGKCIKDLARLGRDLRRVVMVDDNPCSYELQQFNGIPIQQFLGEGEGEGDEALTELIPFLTLLSEREDVRPLIQAKYDYDDVVA